MVSAVTGPVPKARSESSCFADELNMVKKISSAKDLELDQMQSRVKAFEGEPIHVYVPTVDAVSLFVCVCVNYLLMTVVLLSSLIAFKCPCICMQALHVCVRLETAYFPMFYRSSL